MTLIRHLHSSGRFDRPANLLHEAVLDYQGDADLITLTEVQFQSRKDAVRKANGKQFKSVFGNRGNHNDAVVTWDTSKFTLVHSENKKASSYTYKMHNGHVTSPIYATIAVLKDLTTGKRIVVSVVHLASSVEGDLSRSNKSLRTISWYAALRGVKKYTNKLKWEYRCDAAMIVADFNINFKRPVFKALIKALAPRYKITWKKTNVPGGTHGKRIIDATLIRGNLKVVRGAKLYKDDPSSDHRPYIETLSLKE